ncbi:uncharacterized protein C2845_PM04G19390 [Panicum miliaceum]|uniref:Uncharacterized protein n=1 Tax=Panicum miliaceum TaxID=4540 RepID=A0A3L6QNU5_PANMI|nr:uncharacterized protein C2845_PM04G19390 [Panicum miliaceum]
MGADQFLGTAEGGLGGEALYCAVILWLSVVSWIIFSWPWRIFFREALCRIVGQMSPSSAHFTGVGWELERIAAKQAKAYLACSTQATVGAGCTRNDPKLGKRFRRGIRSTDVSIRPH